MTGRPAPKQCPRCDHNHQLWAAAGVVILCPGQQERPAPPGEVARAIGSRK